MVYAVRMENEMINVIATVFVGMKVIPNLANIGCGKSLSNSGVSYT